MCVLCTSFSCSLPRTSSTSVATDASPLLTSSPRGQSIPVSLLRHNKDCIGEKGQVTMLSRADILKQEEEQERADKERELAAGEELRKVELHKLDKQQKNLSLNKIKREWHKLPKAESKFYKRALSAAKIEQLEAKNVFLKDRSRMKRAESLQCKARLKELQSKIKQVDAQLQGSIYKQKKRFAYQRKTIMKSVAMKDWYAKQLALEEVCKIKDKHLETLKSLSKEHKKTICMLKAEAIQDLKEIKLRKGKQIRAGKRYYLTRKGWTLHDTTRQYEDVLEYEDAQAKDSEEIIAHLMHSDDGNRQYILDSEKHKSEKDGTFFPNALYRDGILQ